MRGKLNKFHTINKTSVRISGGTDSTVAARDEGGKELAVTARGYTA